MGVIMVVVIFMFLMINEAENLFMCFLAIYTSSLKKCLFKTFAHFLKSACISAFELQVLVLHYMTDKSNQFITTIKKPS